MSRFSIYTLVSIATYLGVGACGLVPQAAAATSSLAFGQFAPVHLTDASLCAPVRDAYDTPPEPTPETPAVDVALQTGGSCDGVGSGPQSSVNGSAVGRLSASLVLPPPLPVRWVFALDPPFALSPSLSEVFEPPRSAG